MSNPYPACNDYAKDGDCGLPARIMAEWTHDLNGQPIVPGRHTTVFYYCRKHENNVFRFATNCKLTITIL